MKLSIHVFSVYMILLALVPCADGNGGIIEFVNHVSGIEHTEYAHHEHHDNSCTDDNCSPFCICNCCSLAIKIPNEIPLEIRVPIQFPSDEPIFYVDVFWSEYKFSIWQPPRFS